MEKIYLVSEAAEALETEVYTLRYWENQLGLEVPRNAAGHRYYEETQIQMFRDVKRLKEAGFGLRQIKAMGDRMKEVAALPEDRLTELRNRIIGLEAEQEAVFSGRVEKNVFEEPVSKAEPELTDAEMQTMEEKQESFSLCVSETDNRTAAVREDRNEGMRMLQEGMSKWLGELLQKNNENLSQKIEEGVSERMARELRFLFRLLEEREEERYRRLDRTIREHQQARANVKQAMGMRENFLFAGKLRPLR